MGRGGDDKGSKELGDVEGLLFGFPTSCVSLSASWLRCYWWETNPNANPLWVMTQYLIDKISPFSTPYCLSILLRAIWSITVSIVLIDA